jgi:hypothetical protein
MKISLSTSRTYVDQIRQSPQRLLMGIAIMLISGFIGSFLIQQNGKTFVAYELTRDIAAGSLITEADVLELQLPISAASDRWLTAEQLLLNQQSGVALSAGSLLLASDLTQTVLPGDSIGLNLDSGFLPKGLQVGEIVQLWSIDPQAESSLVAQSIILAIDHDDSARTSQLTVRVADEVTSVVLQQAAAGTLRVVVHA